MESDLGRSLQFLIVVGNYVVKANSILKASKNGNTNAAKTGKDRLAEPILSARGFGESSKRIEDLKAGAFMWVISRSVSAGAWTQNLFSFPKFVDIVWST